MSLLAHTPPTYDARQSGQMRVLQGSPLASFHRRAAALAIDSALAGALFLFVLIPLLALHVRAGLLHVEGDVNLRLGFFWDWYSVLWLVLYSSLATYLGKGSTPGKRLMRIRVVPLMHERLGLWHSIERALGYGASALELGFGFVQYFLHPNRQTVHDRIAETIVVDERGGPKPAGAVAVAEAPEVETVQP